jgi:hypothetical protein
MEALDALLSLAGVLALGLAVPALGWLLGR